MNSMSNKDEMVCFKKEELRGSRLRCLMLTSGSRAQTTKLLQRLVNPVAQVRGQDTYMPRAFLQPDEAKLGTAPDFLSPGDRETLTDWWLKVRRNANTPNWDIVSECVVEGSRGLLLVEAKGHDTELKTAGKNPSSNSENHERIGAAIEEANNRLNAILPGWSLSRDSHYQLSNRFAWAWKVASLGTPVVLIYLGFQNADEMRDIGKPFTSAKEWEDCLRAHCDKIVPAQAWETPLDVCGTPLWPLIRSIDIRYDAVNPEHAP